MRRTQTGDSDYWLLHNKVNFSPQFSLLPESGDQLGTSADVSQLAASEGGQVGEIIGGEVGQPVLFEIAPDIFDGIEFGRVSRQGGGVNVALEALEIVPHRPAPVNHGSIPNDQQFAGQLALKVFQKLDDLRAFDGSRIKSEIEVPDGDAADDRQLLPVEVKFQHGRLAARGPGAHPMGLLAESTFINEDNDSVFFQGF